MIRINGLTKAFGGNGVLSGVDLEVKQGEIVTIIGPSGAGKTTLLRTLNWLDVPDGGTIQIDDVQATDTDVLQLLRYLQGVAAVFGLCIIIALLQTNQASINDVYGRDNLYHTILRF